MKTTRICKEEIVYFSDRSRLTGKPSRRRLWNWAKLGLISDSGKRVTLEYAKIGGSWATSIEAYERFIQRINGEIEA